MQGRILGGKRRRIEERKRGDGGGKAKRSGMVRCRNDKYSSMSLPYPVFLSTHESQKFAVGILWRYNKALAPLTSTGP